MKPPHEILDDIRQKIFSAVVNWKRETDREGIPLDDLSDAEICLYRHTEQYMRAKGLKGA